MKNGIELACMNILDANIGSAKDNMSSPVHNWYKFTAGFSYKFVDIILEGHSVVSRAKASDRILPRGSDVSDE